MRMIEVVGMLAYCAVIIQLMNYSTIFTAFDRVIDDKYTRDEVFKIHDLPKCITDFS